MSALFLLSFLKKVKKSVDKTQNIVYNINIK